MGGCRGEVKGRGRANMGRVSRGLTSSAGSAVVSDRSLEDQDQAKDSQERGSPEVRQAGKKKPRKAVTWVLGTDKAWAKNPPVNPSRSGGLTSR